MKLSRCRTIEELEVFKHLKDYYYIEDGKVHEVNGRYVKIVFDDESMAFKALNVKDGMEIRIDELYESKEEAFEASNRKGLAFREAFKALKEGKAVRRHGFAVGYVKEGDDILTVFQKKDGTSTLKGCVLYEEDILEFMEDILQNDWEIFQD